MLEEVRIEGLGVIDEAVLELAPGLTVLTGETGAGKTMVVTALGLLLGGRADAGTVRSGHQRAAVEGRLALAGDSPAVVRANEAGAELDDGALIVARTVSAEGRSRAFVGGRAVPASVLAEIGADLVAVHGQSDQQRLLQPSRQRDALDRYAGTTVAKPLALYRERYERHRDVVATLRELTERARERAQEADLLRLGLSEVEAADPKPGEDAELAAEAERLTHADALRSAAETAHQALLGDPTIDPDGVDAAALVGEARHALDAMRDHDGQLAGLADRLAEAGYLLSDIGTELASYAASAEADPARLEAVQERRAVLIALTRKYGEDVAAVLEWAKDAAKRLAEVEGDDDRVAELRAERERLDGELDELAAALTDARTGAAARFGRGVSAELTDLAMSDARVEVEVNPGETRGPSGRDDVEMLLVPHAGAPARPLHRGASGGELSRVMLAVEVVFAGSDPVPTFVFDEVDAGVGGKAAVEVGRRLARLAATSQVIVVTHLPQVAAFADRHLSVRKSGDGGVTASGVERLDEAARVRELSRMLGGLEDSELGQAHADELLAVAAPDRSGRPRPQRPQLTGRAGPS
ncbi:MAG: DNA repair protein RecN [Streptosporangiales bacterium]|nr:DNA repair protein RecN [Streptosporangiales bacterium]